VRELKRPGVNLLVLWEEYRALAVSLVVAHRSNLSRRVRAFMKWIENVLAPYLE
jgi:DNA-binding transcriptional LysR family regulator